MLDLVPLLSVFFGTRVLIYVFSKQMGRLVRILKGEWAKSKDGVWNFVQDHQELGVEIWASDSESLKDFLDFVGRDTIFASKHLL